MLVEADDLIAELERDFLEASNFQVEIELDGDRGLKKALRGDYDALILDVMLPGENGFEICREVRRSLNLPVIMVTAKKEDVDKIRGLGLGADDYIVKPFSPAELVARVHSHIKMHERLLEEKRENQKSVIQIDDIAVYPGERRVYKNEEEILLTNKEFELLLFFIENPNIVFSKDVLFERIWGMDSAGSTATVTVHINRLREKIEKDVSDPRLIETVWGAGYRFKLRYAGKGRG